MEIDLGQTIEILANIGVLAGIGFLAYELRQNTRALKLSSAHDFLSNEFTFDLRVATDPELATLILKGTNSSELTEVERFRLSRWAFAGLRQWEHAHYLYRIGALVERFWVAMRHELQNILSVDPSASEFWKANRSSFTEPFNSVMETIIPGGRI